MDLSNARQSFLVLFDSLKLHVVFLRFLLISICSFLLDFLIFITLHHMDVTLFKSLLIARLCSSSFNFINNKLIVYKSMSRQSLMKELIGYIVLAVFILGSSYYLISFLHWIGLQIVIAKILSDVFLFSLSFIIQRIFVFNQQQTVI